MKKALHGLLFAVLATASLLAPSSAQSNQEWTRPCASLIREDDFSALVLAGRLDASGLSLAPGPRLYVDVSISLPTLSENIFDTALKSDKSTSLQLSLDLVNSPREPGLAISLLFPNLGLSGVRTLDDARKKLANLDCRFTIDGVAMKKDSDLSVRWSTDYNAWSASCSSRTLDTTFAKVSVSVVNSASGAIAYEGHFNASVPPKLMKRIKSESHRTYANASLDTCK